MKKVTNDGKRGGTLEGKPHYDKKGKDVGGIKAVVTDAGNKPVELEGGEVIINKEASRKHWKLLSKINQSAGNGVPIHKPSDPHDEDPSEEYERGGNVDFNVNNVPNKWIINYAKKIKANHPEVWKLGGNIFGNEAFKNLSRVSERGYWLDSEEWMYKKWQSFVARHQHDFRIAGVIAMLKWAGKVNKGWAYMKDLIEAEIQKREGKKKKGWKSEKSKRMSNGGSVEEDCIEFIKKSASIKTNGHYLHIKNLNIFVGEGDNVVPNINSLLLVTYNSVGQPNLKASKTINASALSKEISKLIGGNINVARIIVSEQIRHAKRFSVSVLKGLENENIIVADRDRIVCTNLVPNYEDGGSVESGCIEFIKNTETLLINGYYVDLKDIHTNKQYAEFGLPKNLDFILIGYNSGGQGNINSRQTISGEGVRLLSEFLNVTKQQSYLILDYYDKNSRRLDTLKILDDIKNRHIVIVNRDTIECTNYEPKFDNGGSVDFENELFDELAQHDAPSFKKGGNVVTYKQKFNRKYGFDKDESHSLSEISKLTKIKLSALQDIYDKGVGAYKTNPQSVRPNVKSKEQWAMARVYSAVMGGKAARVDANELERGRKYHLGGDMTKHLAPNGKPSNLTHEQWHLVRTPEFKAWFGDWENDPENSGKVSGITKEPTIWYHSTKSNFLSKKGENIFRNPPFFFGLKKDISEKIVGIQHRNYKGKITTKAFFVRYKNPFDITKFDILSDKRLTKIIKENTLYSSEKEIRFFQLILGLPNSEKNTWVLTEIREVQEWIKSKGYDSFFVYEDGAKNLAVFEPNQIKLADGSNTTFDGGNPDIRYSEGGGISDYSKVASASSRFKPSETIVFNPPLVGINGAKLTAYTWAYEKVMLPNYEGELVGRRISDWTQAEASAETGRDIVHKYTIELPNGETRVVSSESVPMLLGYVDRSQAKVFGNLATASKTLAKQQMKLATLEAQQKEYNDAIKSIIDKGYPKEIVVESKDFGKYKLMIGDGSCVINDDGSYDNERLECARESYVGNRLSEMGFDRYKSNKRFAISELKPRIERQKRKVEQMLNTTTMENGGQTDDEGNLINLKIGDIVVEYKRPTPNQPKREIGGNGKIILIVGAMAKVNFEPNDYEQWIALKDLKKVENKMKYGGELSKGIKTEMEHSATIDKFKRSNVSTEQVATAIAKDHLKENKKYYSRLSEVERKMKRGGNAVVLEMDTPDGEKTRLTYFQQNIVRTQTFKEFFGDWETAAKNFIADGYLNFDVHYANVSKVIDLQTLEPIVLFHGTNSDKEFFDFDVATEKQMGRPYAYFAYEEKYAENFMQFSQRNQHGIPLKYKAFINVRRPFYALGSKFELQRGNEDYWFKVITDRMIFDILGSNPDPQKVQDYTNVFRTQIYSFLEGVFINNNLPFWTAMARDNKSVFKRFLMTYKYDGIIYHEEISTNFDVSNPSQYTKAVTVFNANDIKLADGRNLTFDPMKSDVRYAEGGNIKTDNVEVKQATKVDELGKQLFGNQYVEKFGMFGSEKMEISQSAEQNHNNLFVQNLINKLKK